MLADILHLQWLTCSSTGADMILCIEKHDPMTQPYYCVDLFDENLNGCCVSSIISTERIVELQTQYQVTQHMGELSAKAAHGTHQLAFNLGVKAKCKGQDQPFFADLLAVLDLSCNELSPVGTGLFRDNLETVYEWSPSGQHLAVTEIWYGDARAFHIWDASLKAITYSVDTNEGYRQHACWTPCSRFCIDPLSMQLLSMKDLHRQYMQSNAPQTSPPQQMVTSMDDHARTDPLRMQSRGCDPSMSPGGGVLLELRQNEAWEAYVQQFKLAVRGQQGWVLPDKVPKVALKASSCVPLIAWCPCPVALYIYAVADDACKVHLLDGRSATVLGTWVWDDCSMTDKPDGTDTQSLLWSPDGLKLAFSGVHGTHVIAFDFQE